MFKESSARSLLKMFTWRILATFATFMLVYFFTGRKEVALAVGGLDIVVKLGLYYGHERIWDKVEMGRDFCKEAASDL